MLRFNAVAVTENIAHSHVGPVRVYVWELATSETGDPITIPAYNDVTIQLREYTGTGDVTIEGSAEPPGGSGIFGPLDDAQGVALALNVEGQVETVLQNVYQLRPVADGNVTTATVVALVR